MGIIRAIARSAGSALADQWLEAIEPEDMGAQTLMTRGVLINRKSQNRKGSKDVITDGSVIHVYDNQFMILTDGGKVVDYSAEPGYYTVDNKAAPSLFNGDLTEAIEESFHRLKYGGQTPVAQKVYYINLQEIRGIKFGTKNPINYFDNFYNSELFLRAHGTYSIRVTDPLKCYEEVVPRNSGHVEFNDVGEQFLFEFLEAFQSSINQMSADGIRISYVASKARELGEYMSTTLDEEWKGKRGIEIESVGIGSVSYDEESQKLINMRNQGAMLGDPAVREGYIQGSVARGMEAAGGNAGGAALGFMGMHMGMQAGGGVIGAAADSNQRQMAAQSGGGAQNRGGVSNGGTAQGGGTVQSAGGRAGMAEAAADAGKKSWICDCGLENTGKFCPECGKAAPAAEWICKCGTENTGKFCTECGQPRP